MPHTVMSFDPPRVGEYMEWDEYDVRDGEILQDLVKNHAERKDGTTARTANHLYVTFPDTGDHRQQYRFSADGSIMSSFKGPDVPTLHQRCTDTARRRHETMTRNRLNALVGRANKTAELVDYVEAFEEYGLEETVFEAYVEGPVLDGSELEKTVLEREGPDVLETIREDRVELFDHQYGLFDIPGVSNVDLNDQDRYEAVVTQVSGEEDYVWGMDADILDLETCTKGRNMTDFYATDWETRREYRDIYYTVLSAAADRLDMEHILERREHQFRYGIWPD